MANMNGNGTLVPAFNQQYPGQPPYPQQQYQGHQGQPIIQPIIQPVVQPIIPQAGQLIPMPYPGHNTAADYLYPSPLPPYSGHLDYGVYPRGYGSPRMHIPRRKRGRMARMMEALFMGGEVDRLRMLEMQAGMGGEYAYGMGGMGGMGGMYGRGMMDDGYGSSYGYGSRGMRGYGYHGRGCRCPECMEEYYL